MTVRFVPMIVPTTTANPSATRSAMRRELRKVFEQALQVRGCAEAVAEFKGNGFVRGHKLLDTAAAVEALTKTAPEHLRAQIKASPCNQYEQAQVLDAALRRHFELDKAGKLTGRPSKRLLLANAGTPPMATDEQSSAE